MANAVVLTGCSGAGKSTLLDALARRGHRVVPEVGRQIVKEELAAGGDGLPWRDAGRFVDLALARSIEARRSLEDSGETVLLDRSVVDIVSHARLIGHTIPAALGEEAARCRYAREVFVAPPWPEIFAGDAERRKTFEAAVREFEALREDYLREGYELVEIPRAPVDDRIRFVESRLDGQPSVTPVPVRNEAPRR